MYHAHSKKAPAGCHHHCGSGRYRGHIRDYRWLALLVIFAPLGIFALIVGVVSLFVAWGLWTLKPWAFWLVVIVEVIHLVQAIFSLARGQGTGIGDIVFPVIILLYLFLDRNVRAAFRT